ncbi:2OG-Fe(II) oxygenase [soil metagenome]
MKDISTIPWKSVYQSLDDKGYTLLPSLLSNEECDHLSDQYPKSELYRSTINMERYRFGKGEYKYFTYPLPALLQNIRTSLYPGLAILGNDWMARLGIDTKFPLTQEELINECHIKGQIRPTPLILRYEATGFNTLHQDLYGDVYFPFQVVIVLNEVHQDYEGGEFILIEQIPRAQSRAEVISPHKGDALIFTTNFRPMKGTRGYYRAKMKHGISPLKSGIRFALGVIFHDAK